MKIPLLQLNKKIMTDKKFLIISAVFIGVICVLAFQNLYINKVSAQIIPVSVSINHLAFGTVFPGEELQGNFIVTYATTGDGVYYRIIQKPKACPTENPTCGPDGHYRDMCPFLEKVSDEGEGDVESSAFVGEGDISDTWIIYFKVPAIFGNVSQDHAGGVISEGGDYGCDISIDIIETPQ